MTSAALPGDHSVPRYRFGLTITAMDQLQLRPMTVAEFETYQARLVPGYAGLNVFGTNTVARRLYESSGYQITSMNMRKELGAT